MSMQLGVKIDRGGIKVGRQVTTIHSGAGRHHTVRAFTANRNNNTRHETVGRPS